MYIASNFLLLCFIEKLASASYYQESVHLLRKNSAACSLLGPPVRFKALNLRSPDNIVTEEKAHVMNL